MNRDYKKEYSTRRKRDKRLAVDMNRTKAERFQKLLAGRGETFSNWINRQIDKELKGPK
jgi:hypothetical protein